MSRVARLLRPREGLVAIALLLGSGLAGIACASSGSDDASEGRIAFEIAGERLAIANADGSGDPTVVRHPVDSWWIALSPDGEKIAYRNPDALWVMNADGTGLHQVFESPDKGILFFAWSPDGGRIAIHDAPLLYVVDADGTDGRPIGRCRRCLDPPVWSPDGHTIAYTAHSDAQGYDIHLVDSDGTGKRGLTSGRGPSWSPDGKQIAFTRTPWPPYELDSDGNERDALGTVYVIKSEGGGMRRLARGKSPEWSPDGSRIAFTRTGVVYVIDSDGSGGERRIGRGDYFAWSPGGKHIAVRRDRKPPDPRLETAIWVLNADGSGERRIWPRRGFCECSLLTWLR